MDPSFLFLQFLAGLASASQLFLVACGLTIIFGVTRIVNFAHGSLYMLGAYVAYSLGGPAMASLGPVAGFWAATLGAALVVGGIGLALEILVLRRIYRAPELFQLVATFGVVLIVQDAVLAIWGAQDLMGPRAPGLSGAVEILGRRFPEYELVLIAAGPVVLAALWGVFHRTRWGVLVRAATQDREMVGALGVNQALLFTGVVCLGAALAGLAGALQLPREPANPFMDVNVIVEAFVVTVIGGMGSVVGAFLAALIIGQLQAFGILVFPKITLVLVFLVMAVVLVLRPRGLLGREESGSARGEVPSRPLVPMGRAGRLAWTAILAAAVLVPPLLDAFALKLLTEVLVFSLFAMSLGFLMGTGGMISFGHAAFFGLGAYAAALAVEHFAVPMTPALIAAPLAAAAGAALFGVFVVRLSGVYAAMLTLAFAQIVWSMAFQWYEVTGGDNGILGVWPADWASGRLAYYYLALVLAGAAIWGLRRATFAPFGYALRAGRDSAARADAIGIDVRRVRWVASLIAGAAAGLAGGLYAFSRGSVDPEVLAIPTSVDALVMVLLGGVHAVLGPLAGGVVLPVLEAYVMPLTDYWRLLLGLIILALVLAFPGGLAGVAEGLGARLGRGMPGRAGADSDAEAAR
ncbi:MAG: ABC transporter permease [Azospirillaceae bacterium]